MYEYKYTRHLGVLNVRSKFTCIELSNVIVGNPWPLSLFAECQIIKKISIFQ